MDIIHFPDDPRPARWMQPVLALGNFDGVHRGHRKILDRVRRVRRRARRDPVVMTFDPHPPRVVRPDKAPPLLMTHGAEARRARGRRRSGRGHRPLHARAVAVGSRDVRAGRCSSTGCASPRCGSAPTSCSATIAPATSRCCASLGARYGFKAEKIDPIRYKDFVVSSTRIRRLVSEGRVDEAGALLGHRYSMDGVVVRGDGRGRGIGFPTANLCTDNELLPPHGVYATTATIDGMVRPSVTNIGVRPDGGRARADGDRDARLRLRPGSVRGDGPPRVRAAAARRAGVRVARCAARRRSPPTAERARGAVRSAFTVESRACPAVTISLRVRVLRAERADRRRRDDLAAQRAAPRRRRRDGARRSRAGRRRC